MPKGGNGGGGGAPGGGGGGGGDPFVVLGLDASTDSGFDGDNLTNYATGFALTGTIDPTVVDVSIVISGTIGGNPATFTFKLSDLTVVDGNWTLNFALATFDDGAVQVDSTYDVPHPKNGKIQTQPAAPYSFSVDTTAPDTPSGLSASGSVISGTAESGATIHIYLDGAYHGMTPADGSGNWSYDVGTDTGSFTAVAEDAAENFSFASTAVAIGGGGGGGDTTAPTASAPDLVASSDTGSSNTDNITNDATATFRFTLDPTVEQGDTIELLVGGVADVSHAVTAQDISNGHVDLTSTALAEGANTISARLYDAATNETTTASLVVTYDGTMPVAGTPDLDAGSDSGASSSDNLTNDASATFTIALTDAAVGDTIELKVNGAVVASKTLVQAEIDAASVQLTGALGADGAKSVTATMTDAAGNSSSSAALAVTLDTQAPGISTPDLAAASDSGGSSSDNITSDSTPEFRIDLGAGASAGDEVVLVVDGGDDVSHTVTAGDIAIGYMTLTATALGDGGHSIAARITDQAGNTATTANLGVTVDTAGPAAPTGVDLASGSDTGSSNSDNLTADDTPTITGIGEAGATINLYAGAVLVGTGVVAGNGTWSITSSALADGAHNLTAVAVDAAGNSSASSTALAVTVDTAAPAAPDVTTVRNADGSVAAGGATDDETPEIEGTAAAGSTVEVFVNGASIGTTTADQFGNWSIVAAALADAVYTVTATAADAAGNVSAPSSGFQMEVDAIPDPPPGESNPDDDPLYTDQWHLTMIGDIQTIWEAFDGSGVSVGVYDNGVEYTHPDLYANYDASKHVIVGGQALDPAPSSVVTAEHGTAVAGVIAAVDNTIGGVGVAFGASITGVNIFGGPADINGADVSGFTEAINQAWTFDIINNSWGTLPNFNHETDPSMLAALAGFETAVQTGRGGLGTIVLKAAGNDWDSSQEFLNASRYTITVAAHDQDGDASWYTNRGANVLVSAPSSGSSADGDEGILTTDETGGEGYAAGDFTYGFGGTSSATPVVSGVVALMLDANPDLGWRDVQSILAHSAMKIGNPVPGATAPVAADSDGDGTPDTTVEFPVEFFSWYENAATTWNGGGLHFSEDYGFGGVDAYAAVRMAEVWLLFADAQTSINELSFTGTLQTPALAFDNQWVSASYTYAGPQMELEYVEVYVDFKSGGGLLDLYGNMEDVSIDLVSPSGTVVSLMQASNGYDSTNNYLNPFPDFESGGQVTWTYGVNALRGETVTGDWTVRIMDIANDVLFDGGTLNQFQFTFYGAGPDNDDVYHYTDEVFGILAAEPGRATLIDSDGNDWLNMAAMTGDITVDLASNGSGGASSAPGGTFIDIASGTQIENAVTGDGDDILTGNSADNQLAGMRGDDEYWGFGGDDTFIFFAGGGQDLIWDFDYASTIEVIELHGFAYDSFSQLTLVDLGGTGTLVDLSLGDAGGDQITLAGVNYLNLSDNDFVFV